MTGSYVSKTSSHSLRRVMAKTSSAIWAAICSMFSSLARMAARQRSSPVPTYTAISPELLPARRERISAASPAVYMTSVGI